LENSFEDRCFGVCTIGFKCDGRKWYSCLLPSISPRTDSRIPTERKKRSFTENTRCECSRAYKLAQAIILIICSYTVNTIPPLIYNDLDVSSDRKRTRSRRNDTYHQPSQSRRCPRPKPEYTLLCEYPIRTMKRVFVLLTGFQGLHSGFYDTTSCLSQKPRMATRKRNSLQRHRRIHRHQPCNCTNPKRYRAR